MKTSSILSLLFIMLLMACGNSQQSPQLSPDDFKNRLSEVKDPQLVDVRTEEEFNDGYLSGAVNFDIYQQDFTRKINGLDKNEPVFVYCARGGRSADAASILKKEGFTEVYDLAGGIEDWEKKGNQVVK